MLCKKRNPLNDLKPEPGIIVLTGKTWKHWCSRFRKRPNRQDIFIHGQAARVGIPTDESKQCKHRSSSIEVPQSPEVQLFHVQVVSFSPIEMVINLDISWNGGFLKKGGTPFGYINFHRMLEWIFHSKPSHWCTPMTISQRIHGAGIFTYIDPLYVIFQIIPISR